MANAKKRKVKVGAAFRSFDPVHWLRRCEALIAKHSTPARTHGKYKGHGDTDAVAWIKDITAEAQSHIRRANRSKAYDENMALGSLVGAILVTWYCNLHRAKTYDPNRPLELRRIALQQRNDFIGILFKNVHSDELMSTVWSGQAFNFPFGLLAADGDFV